MRKQRAWAMALGLALAITGCAANTPSGDTDAEEDVAREEAVAPQAALRFDVATLNCGSSAPDATCAPSDEKCLCMDSIEALNYDDVPHFLAVGTDNNKSLINGAGNYQAVYVNAMNDGWTQMSGAAWADTLVANLKGQFPKGLPKWFFMNEISAGKWPDNAEYRQFVVDMASRLKNTHGRNVIIAAPFAHPGNNGPSWQALAKSAWIAAEVYLTGADVNLHANSVSWCQSQYAASKSAYLKLGVPADKLMLVEHFGNTAKGTAWGRSGVSVAGWHNAIAARSKAAAKVGFAGFISYSWASNQMHDTEVNRLAYVDTYAAQVLP